MPSVSDYLRAGVSLIHIDTTQYQEALNDCLKALKSVVDPVEDENFRVGVFKRSKPFTTVALNPTSTLSNGFGKKVLHETYDLADSIDHVLSAEEKYCLIVFNGKDLLKEDTIDYIIDAVYAFREDGYLIFIGPRFEYPIELRNFVTFVDFELPTREHLINLFTGIADEYKEKILLPNGKTWAKEKKGKKLSNTQKDLLDKSAMACLGLDILSAETAFALSIVCKGTIDIDFLYGHKEQEANKSDVLDFIHHRESVETIGGFGVLKEWLSKRRKVFTQEARDYGLPYPKGILLVGISGTGKSLSSKVVASYLNLPLLRLDLSRVYRSYVGESEQAIQYALKIVEAVAPCCLMVDEVDKVLAGSNRSDHDGGVTSRVISTILTWRAETTAPVMMVATANSIEGLPAMLYRKGRIDEVFYVGMPELKEREEIFRIHLQKRNRIPDDYDTSKLAELSVGLVGAEIEAVIEDAMFNSFSLGRELYHVDLKLAIQDLIPQSRRDADEIEALEQWAKGRARNVSVYAKEEN